MFIIKRNIINNSKFKKARTLRRNRDISHRHRSYHYSYFCKEVRERDDSSPKSENTELVDIQKKFFRDVKHGDYSIVYPKDFKKIKSEMPVKDLNELSGMEFVPVETIAKKMIRGKSEFVIALSTALTYRIKDIRSEINNKFKIKPIYYKTTSVRGKRKRLAFLYLEINADNFCKDQVSPSFMRYKDHTKHIYWFEEGTVVTWGCDDEDINSILKYTKFYEVDPLEPEKEEMPFEYSDISNIDPTQDVIVLAHTATRTQLDRLIYSVAFARSAKLYSIEREIQDAVMRAGAPNFPLFKKVNYMKPYQEIAAILAIKHQLTYGLATKETPSFLWEHGDAEEVLYHEVALHLDIDERIEAAQEKLEVPIKYWNIKQSSYYERSGQRLEIIIVILILIEVLLTLSDISYWENFYPKVTLQKWFGEDRGYELVEEVVIEKVYIDNEQKKKNN